MQEFTNETIDIDQLPKYETVLLAKPHASYWKVIAINLLIFLLVTAAILVALFLNVTEFRPYLYPIIGTYLLLAISLFALYRASFKRRGFALREKDIIYQSGIIASTTTVVPFNRIQHVALEEGVLSRMFKLGSLQLFTAGGQSGHLTISGIEIEMAKNIRQQLLKNLGQTENLTPAS
jgi:membrane protein YdbS with pleckstrin-like domain